MPISRDEFETVAPEKSGMSTAEAVLAYLLENDEQAFTRTEIAESIDRKPNTVSTNLSRLKDRGFVDHKGSYWAVTENEARRDEMRDTMSTLTNTRAFGVDDSFIADEKEAEEWAEAAADYDEVHGASESDDNGVDLSSSETGLNLLNTQFVSGVPSYGLIKGDTSNIFIEQTDVPTAVHTRHGEVDTDEAAIQEDIQDQ